MIQNNWLVIFSFHLSVDDWARIVNGQRYGTGSASCARHQPTMIMTHTHTLHANALFVNTTPLCCWFCCRHATQSTPHQRRTRLNDRLHRRILYRRAVIERFVRVVWSRPCDCYVVSSFPPAATLFNVPSDSTSKYDNNKNIMPTSLLSIDLNIYGLNFRLFLWVDCAASFRQINIGETTTVSCPFQCYCLH